MVGLTGIATVGISDAQYLLLASIVTGLFGLGGIIVAIVLTAKVNNKLKRRNGSTVGEGADHTEDSLAALKGRIDGWGEALGDRLENVEMIVATSALEAIGDRRVNEHILRLHLAEEEDEDG